MTKTSSCVRNWRNYNKSLIARGSITVWVDEKSLKSWYENATAKKVRGRPKTYSNTAIYILLTLKQIYRLRLRSCQGFAKSLFKLMGVNLNVPYYTQLCRRQRTVRLPSLPQLSGGIHMVIDSSGLKLFGEGEWKVRQHGWTRHRMWRKLHIGVDENSQFIVSAELTKNDCGDDKQLPKLLNQYKGKLNQVSADGAYDSHDCHDEINRRGAIATIPPQPNPRHKTKMRSEVMRPRDKVVWAIQQQGRKEWKQHSGYHRRSLAETAFYRYKQLLGAQLSARHLESQKIEALINCHLLNKMTMLAMQ